MSYAKQFLINCILAVYVYALTVSTLKEKDAKTNIALA